MNVLFYINDVAKLYRKYISTESHCFECGKDSRLHSAEQWFHVAMHAFGFIKKCNENQLQVSLTSQQSPSLPKWVPFVGWQPVQLLCLKGVFAHSAEKSTIAARNIRGVTGVATRQSVRLQQQQELQVAPKKLQTSSRSRIRVLGLSGWMLTCRGSGWPTATGWGSTMSILGKAVSAVAASMMDLKPVRSPRISLSSAGWLKIAVSFHPTGAGRSFSRSPQSTWCLLLRRATLARSMEEKTSSLQWWEADALWGKRRKKCKDTLPRFQH